MDAGYDVIILGSGIAGLAIGVAPNTAARLEFGAGYQAGLTLASAMTFGCLAAEHMAARTDHDAYPRRIHWPVQPA